MIMIKKLFASQLRLNMVSGVAKAGINSVALMVAYPIYLHYLGYEMYGVWLVLATVLTFAQLGNLGIAYAVIKLVSEEYATENIEGVQSYVAMALMILTVTGTIMLVVILLFKAQIVAVFGLDNKNAELVSRLLPYIGLLSIYIFLVNVLTATISGLGRMDLSNYTQIAGRITAVGMSLLLLCFGYGVTSLLIGNSLSCVIVHIVSLALIRYQAKVHFLRLDNWNWQRFKRLLSFGSGVFGGGLVNMLLDPFNKLMLSRYAGVASVPVYEISYKGAMMIKGLVDAGLRAIIPEISRVGAKMTIQAKTRISAINTRLMKLILIYVIPIYLAVFIFAEILLRIWLRDKYVEQLPGYFRVMLIASFVSLLGIPAYYTLMGQGHVRCCFGSNAVLFVINVAVVLLHAIILPSIVESRICYAVLLGYLGSTAFLFWQFWRHNKDASDQIVGIST